MNGNYCITFCVVNGNKVNDVVAI